MKLEESGEKHKGNRQRTVIAGRVKIPRKDSRRTIPSPVNTRSEKKILLIQYSSLSRVFIASSLAFNLRKVSQKMTPAEKDAQHRPTNIQRMAGS